MIGAILLYSYCAYSTAIIAYLLYTEYHENSLDLIPINKK